MNYKSNQNIKFIVFLILSTIFFVNSSSVYGQNKLKQNSLILTNTDRSNQSNDNKTVQSIDPNTLVEKLNTLQTVINENAKKISLKEAIAIGLQNNPTLLKSFHEIQSYEWQLIAAQRKWYPTLTLNANPFLGYKWNTTFIDNYAQKNYNLMQNDGRLMPRIKTTKGQEAQSYTSAIVNWNFLDPTRQPNINAAQDSLQQQKYLFLNSARTLILSIQKSYYAIQSSKQLIDNFKDIYEINSKQLEILQAQYDIGMVSVFQIEQTRSQLFGQLNNLIMYTQQYIQQTSQLAEFLALSKGTLAVPSDPAKLYGQWDLTLSETIKKALKQREELLAALSAAESARWRSISFLKSYLPVFGFIAQGNLSSTNGYNNVPIPNDPGEQYFKTRVWDSYTGIKFTWSIFDGGISAANSQAEKAKESQFKDQAALTELQIAQQIRTSYALLNTSFIGVQSAEQAYHSAELAHEAALARFAVGVGDITSVVQAINLLSSAATQKSHAILNYNNAIVELYRYSATWPETSKEELDQRIKMMRNQPNSKSTIETTP